MKEQDTFYQQDSQDYEQYINMFKDHDKKAIQILCKLYKGKFISVLKGCICMIFQRSPVWVIPIVIGNIINLATEGGEDAIRLMMVQFAIGAVFLVQNIGTSYLGIRVIASMNRDIEGKLRNALVRKLQYLSILFHKDTQSGRLQSKVVRDVENIYELLNQIFRTLLFFILDITVIVCVSFHNSPVVLLFFLIALPITMLSMQLFSKPVRENNREFRNEIEATQGAVAQMIEMIPITRAHGLQEDEITKMDTYLNSVVRQGYKLDKINTIFGASNWVIFQMIQLTCLMFTAILAYRGEITLGEVVLYQTYFTQLIGQVSGLINIYPALCKGVESIRSIGDVLEETNIETNNSIVPLGDLSGGVTFSNVGFKYPSAKKNTLQEVSFEVKPGESIAFVGESGGGKSTILNLLIGFMQPTEGKILVDRINMTNLNMNEYRSQIAVVPQNTTLFDGTVAENIAYGLKHIKEEDILEVVRKVGLDDLVGDLPQGIDTRLGEHGDKLSGGQKQRLSIARALIRKPKIVIFDEATSALDNASEKLVQQATEQIMKEATTFVVAHRLSTIRNVDRIMVISKGEIVESGTYDELMARKGAFYHLEK